MRETCVFFALLLIWSCRAPVIDLPAEQALAAMDVLARQGIDSATEARGPSRTITVQRRDLSPARAVLTAAGFPREGPPTNERLVMGPTEARLVDARQARHRLQAALRALPGVLDAQVVRLDSAPHVLLTVRPDPPVTEAMVRPLIGPDARISFAIFEPPPRPITPRPSTALTAIIGLLMLTVVALLIRVRRLRRALGR